MTDKLPKGYQQSDGETPIHGVVHEKGTIVGPHEAPDVVTLECPRCGDRVDVPGAAICQGAALAVEYEDPLTGKKTVVGSGLREDGAPVLLPGARVLLDDRDGDLKQHPPTIMRKVAL